MWFFPFQMEKKTQEVALQQGFPFFFFGFFYHLFTLLQTAWLLRMTNICFLASMKEHNPVEQLHTNIRTYKDPFNIES